MRKKCVLPKKQLKLWKPKNGDYREAGINDLAYCKRYAYRIVFCFFFLQESSTKGKKHVSVWCHTCRFVCYDVNTWLEIMGLICKKSIERMTKEVINHEYHAEIFLRMVFFWRWTTFLNLLLQSVFYVLRCYFYHLSQSVDTRNWMCHCRFIRGIKEEMKCLK